MACPICSKTTVKAYRPFCSKRCADLDMAKWFDGSYAIPTQDTIDVEDQGHELRDVENKKPH